MNLGAGHRLRRVLCALVLPFAAGPAVAVPTALAAPAGIRIPGTDPPSAADSDRTGPAAAGAARSVAVTLAFRDSAELDQVIAAVSTPGSPRYGHPLTPGEFAERFGPTGAQVATVTGYLRSQGLDIAQVSSNNLVVDARGRVADMSRAFGTTLGTYHDRRTGTDYIANDRPVTLRSDVASDVLGVVGLNDHHTRHPHVVRSPTAGGGPAGGYTPAQLQSAYNVAPLTAAGVTGAGQNIGLFELDRFSQSDITVFDNHYGLAAPAPSVRLVDGGPQLPVPGPGEIEVELDIEVAQALAPAASITVWEGPNTDAGVIDTYNAMLAAGITSTNSTSWGLCEPQSAGSTMRSEDAIFQQAAATGMSFFAASGDAGAYDCGDATLAVDNPADDPYVTGAGGTTLRLTPADTYSSEMAWSDPTNRSQSIQGAGSGGGLSSVFASPAWQAGPGVSNRFSNGMRQVPDVASDADPNTGYSIYSAGRWVPAGGTSASAPSWAAFAALYNQNAVQGGRPRLGFANPTLYALASAAPTPPPFHDVTTGSNLFYPATAGWDYATGLGSYDAGNLTLTTPVAVLPAMSNGAYGGYVTAATIQNTSATAASVSISYHDESGAAVGAGDTIATLPANASWTVRQDNGNSFAPGGAGSAIAYSTQPFALFVNEFAPGNAGDATGYTGIPVPSGVGTTLFAPTIVNHAYGGYTTGIGLLNQGGIPTDVTVIYRDGGGAVVTTQTVTGLAANAYRALYSGDAALALPAGFAGTATIVSSGQPLGAIVNEIGPGGQFSSYDAVPAGSTSLTAPVALNSAFGGYSTGIAVQNTSAAGGSVSITYHDSSGAAAGPAHVFTILGKGSLGVSQTSSTDGPVPPGAYTATIQSALPLAAIVNEVAPAGTGSARQSTSYNTFAAGGAVLHLPLVENGGGDPWNTGEGIMNTGSAATTVTVSYHDAVTGAPIGTSQVHTLAPAALWGLYQPDATSGLPAGTRATAVVTAAPGGQLAVITNEVSATSFMSYCGR